MHRLPCTTSESTAYLATNLLNERSLETVYLKSDDKVWRLSSCTFFTIPKLLNILNIFEQKRPTVEYNKYIVIVSCNPLSHKLYTLIQL